MLKSKEWLDRVAAVEKAQIVLSFSEATKKDKEKAAALILKVAPHLLPKARDFVEKAMQEIWLSDSLYPDLKFRAMSFMREYNMTIPQKETPSSNRPVRRCRKINPAELGLA